MPIPKEVIDSLKNDQDFLSLPDTEQNTYLDRIGAKYGNTPKAENILQRAVQGLIQPTMDAVGNTVGGAMNSNPWQVLKGVGSMQSSGYQGIMNAKNDLIGSVVKNPVARFGADVATDPLTYLGAEPVAKGVQKVGEFGSSILNPSKAYGQKLASSKGTVDFLPHIMQAIDDPVAGKLIDKAGILEKFGGTTLSEGGMPMEKLSNLSAEDSQNVINSLKDEVSKAVKEGTLKPKQLQVGKLFGDLSDAQNNAFEGMKDAKFNYGMGKNTQKIANGAFKKIITGSEIGAGGGLAWSAVKHLFGK